MHTCPSDSPHLPWWNSGPAAACVRLRRWLSAGEMGALLTGLAPAPTGAQVQALATRSQPPPAAQSTAAMGEAGCGERARHLSVICITLQVTQRGLRWSGVLFSLLHLTSLFSCIAPLPTCHTDTVLTCQYWPSQSCSAFIQGPGGGLSTASTPLPMEVMVSSLHCGGSISNRLAQAPVSSSVVENMS